MCSCGLEEGLHWYLDPVNAPGLYHIASCSEEAKYFLRSWAAKILRLGHMHLDMRPLAARILRSKTITMVSLCDKPDMHPAQLWIE